MKLEPGHSRCCFRQIFVILFLGGATSLFAGHFQTSFNTDLPAQAKLSGEAVLTQAGGVDNNGALRLTKAHPNQQGTLLLNDLDPGEKIFSFQLAFNLLIAGSDNDKNGDGFSINFAPDLPDQFGAKGAGNGLSICFDTYQKIPDMPGFTIRVKYKGKEVASAFCMLRKEAGYAETKVQLDSDSALTLSYNGTTVLDHSHLFNFVPTTGRFGFGASTSDRFDKHVIDNLSIETDTSRRSADHSYLLPGHNRVLLPQYMSRSLQLGDKEQNTIQALAQTSEGYLWIGTQKGLARSDGMTFTFYTPENTPEITNASVNVLLVAKDGSLWVGTEGGLFQYKNGRFARIARGLLDERVRSLCQIKDLSLIHI